MGYLETVAVEDDGAGAPVPHAGAMGQPARISISAASRAACVGGSVRRGERVRVLPSGKESTVARIVTKDGDLERAVAGQSITLTLDRRDRRQPRRPASRRADSPPGIADQFEATIIWMSEDEMLAGRPYLLKIGAKTVGVDDRRAEVQGQRQHARAPGGEDAASERDRRLQPQSRPADRVRPLRRRTATPAASS